MDSTPTLSRFDDAYKSRTAPWVIGEPQPAIVDLERCRPDSRQGARRRLRNRRAHDPADPVGLRRTRRRLRADTRSSRPARTRPRKGVDARFEVADAMNLGAEPRYDTIVDSALFHIFDDADRAAIRRKPACRVPAGRAGARAGVVRQGPRVRPGGQRSVIREAFGDGWVLEALDETTYRGVVQEPHVRGHRPAGRHGGRRARLAGPRPPPLSDFVRRPCAHRG